MITVYFARETKNYSRDPHLGILAEHTNPIGITMLHCADKDHLTKLITAMTNLGAEFIGWTSKSGVINTAPPKSTRP